jgi:hypothetical protein
MVTVLRKAQTEKRLTCGLIPAIKLLEVDPERALFCIMPQSSQGNAALHIQSVLLQAFCNENDIHIIQVHISFSVEQKEKCHTPFCSYSTATDQNVQYEIGLEVAGKLQRYALQNKQLIQCSFIQFQYKRNQVVAWEFAFFTVQVYPTSLWIFQI